MNVLRPNISLHTFMKTKVKLFFFKFFVEVKIVKVKRVSGKFTMFKY